MNLTDFRTLGRSGLAISPLTLGTMTFGTARWGSAESEARAVFNAYVDAGGNFIDTANVYASGRSEEMLGRFIGERRLRDRLVVASKAGFALERGAHAGGNGAKHIHTALTDSLRRLKTDYLDLYWVHVWDGITPAEELLETMATLVRSGKVRYWGISNAPAWYAAQLVTLASSRALPGPIALQYFYSLVNRDVEDEHLPLAQQCSLGMVPWSPLAYGLLSGKYQRASVEAMPRRAAGLPRAAAADNAPRAADDKRLDGANPFGDSLFTEHNWNVVETVRAIAEEAHATPAQVALAWVIGRPGVTSTLMGVSRPAQIDDNLGALALQLSRAQQMRLDEASQGPARMLYGLFKPALRNAVVFGGQSVSAGGEARC
ncbi:MAG: aldo/keto reductase [Pseudomonadota bacterium]|nr:aldo/keto reductase [Pseudomonadota bacterium]